MSAVAVLGAGGGGLAATVELTHAGHDVVLWNRNPATVEPYRASGSIPYRGVLGTGSVRPAAITTDLAEATAAADAVAVCLPAVAHARLFDELAALGPAVPIILNPGQTGGVLHARHVWAERGVPLPPVAELSTLTYVVRVTGDGVVDVTGRANAVRAGCLPGGEPALEWAERLFPAATPVDDVLASSLSNVNLVLHPPGAVLGLSWVEATGGEFRFYVDGMTPGVVRVLSALDGERRTVARAFGHELPPLVGEMAAIGTVDPAYPPDGDPGEAIRAGEANRRIRSPDSTEHRYYREDLPFGLLPFVNLAMLAGEQVPVAAALLTLGGIAIGDPRAEGGLSMRRLGLDGWTREDLLTLVRQRPAHDHPHVPAMGPDSTGDHGTRG